MLCSETGVTPVANWKHFVMLEPSWKHSAEYHSSVPLGRWLVCCKALRDYLPLPYSLKLSARAIQKSTLGHCTSVESFGRGELSKISSLSASGSIDLCEFLYLKNLITFTLIMLPLAINVSLMKARNTVGYIKGNPTKLERVSRASNTINALSSPRIGIRWWADFKPRIPKAGDFLDRLIDLRDRISLSGCNQPLFCACAVHR